MWLLEHDGPVVILAIWHQNNPGYCQVPLIDYQSQM
jgi:hypothetical protein